MIYHVISNPDWQKALLQGFYEAGSLATEGFIHTSKAEQVAGVLERYYPQDAVHEEQSNLLLLHIDEDKITSKLVYEFSLSVNEEFPHIYGPLNLDAVIKVEEL